MITQRILLVTILMLLVAPLSTSAQALRKHAVNAKLLPNGREARVSIRELGVVETRTIPVGKVQRMLGAHVIAENTEDGIKVILQKKKRVMMAQGARYGLQPGSIVRVERDKELAVVQMSPYTVDVAVGLGDNYETGTIVMGRSLRINGITVEYLGSARNMAILRVQ